MSTKIAIFSRVSFEQVAPPMEIYQKFISCGPTLSAATSRLIL